METPNIILDNTMIVYTTILFLVIGFCLVCIKRARNKIEDGKEVNMTVVMISCFIDAIYAEFLKSSRDVVEKLDLIGVNNYDDFLKKAKQAIIELLKTEVDKYIKAGNPYSDFFKNISTTTLTLILDQICKESMIEEFIEDCYDELINAVENSALEYEQKVAEENKNFEEGTAEVPEYEEEKEISIDEKEIEKIDESELEEPVN